mgnify:CR=1 FL=1
MQKLLPEFLCGYACSDTEVEATQSSDAQSVMSLAWTRWNRVGYLDMVNVVKGSPFTFWSAHSR